MNPGNPQPFKLATARSITSVSIAAALGLAAPAVVSAQDATVPERLDDLIPQEAVENPEGWASDEAQPQDNPQPNLTLPPIDEVEIPTPDTAALDEALELPERREEVEVQSIEERFADLDQLDLPERVALDDVIRVDDRLVLGFPNDNDAFPEKTDFVARFEALSTIEELGGDDSNIAQLAARARADEELLQELLRTYGYYDAQVLRTIGAVQPGEEVADTDPQARFDILPGTRYRFGEIDLGALETAPDYDALLATFGISPGDPLNSDRIVEQRFALDLELGESGYPFAAIDEPRLLVDHERQEGDLTMPVRPGGKYSFGEIISSDPAFLSSRHLQRIARFDPGDTYQRSLEQDLRRAIIATGLVADVTITARPTEEPTGEEAGEVALDVGLERAKLRTIAGAIGYGTEDGFKLEASWEHRNLFPPEGALKVRGILGTREQLIGVGYKRGNWKRRDQVLSFDAYASDISTEAVDARTIALRGTIERLSNLLFQKPFSWAAGAEVLLTDERNRVIGGVERPRQTYRIGSVFGRATIDGSNSLLDPTEGYRVTVFAAPEVSRTSGETSYYLRARTDATYYQPVNDRVVLAGRASVATIQGASVEQIAPSRRLYAGGGGSVRGYGFQAVGSQNDFGEATGGRSLVELSAEARINTGFFDGALQVVPFFDLGAVSIDTTPDFNFVKYGAGVGVRYKTGFGPIRVDLGVPLNPGPGDGPVAVYVSLGQAF